METTTVSAIEKTSSTPHPLMDYELIANLFVYPENERYKEKIKEVYTYLLKSLPESADALKQFIEYINDSSITEIQELFLRSFDLQAITTLDIGFILFGEDYKRGKLLVHLNEEHKKAGNNCETELSDHLPNLLRLLPKLKEDEMRNEIATLLVLPAVAKMVSEFSSEKIEKKDVVYKKHHKVLLDYSQDYRAIYQSCLQALFLVLKKDFGYAPESNELGNETQNLSDPKNPAGYKENIPIKD